MNDMNYRETDVENTEVEMEMETVRCTIEAHNCWYVELGDHIIYMTNVKSQMTNVKGQMTKCAYFDNGREIQRQTLKH